MLNNSITANLWQISPPQRSAAEWSVLFDYVISRLATFLGLPIKWEGLWSDDGPNYLSCGANVQVSGILSEPLNIVLTGVVSISCNRNEWVSVGGDIFAFAHGKRLGTHRCHAPPKHSTPDYFDVRFIADEEGGHWESGGFVEDIYGEWEGLQNGPSIHDVKR